MAERQRGELFASADKEWIVADHEATRPQSHQGCEGRLEVALGARVQDVELKPETARRRLQVTR